MRNLFHVSQDFCTKEEATMKKRVLPAFIMAFVLLNFAYLVAAQETRVTAKLTGAAEVPGPGDSDGSGTVQLTFKVNTREVCYDITVANIEAAEAAHIHEGDMDEDGPVKVPLEAPKTGTAKGCKQADAALIKAIMENPTDYYVNVHNAAFPKGAVRGQLSAPE
jgi:hypothetical protein